MTSESRGAWLRGLALLFTVFAAVSALHPACGAEDGSIGPAASMNEQVLSVPGDPDSPAQLQVTVLSPDGPGPFPLVVMNHGASGSTHPELEPRYHQTFSAFYFLSRGYAVVLPMMRGFAGSQGRQIYNGCNQDAVGISNAKDIRAVIDYFARQPYIDARRVVVAGQSFGGWNALAVGTLGDPRVRGIINFAGGANISNCPSTQAALAHGAFNFGTETKIPSIWFYGDNDTRFPPAVWRTMHESYTAAGGNAELVAYGTFMPDAHNMLGNPEGLRIWVPRVDAFLGRLGLPNKVVHPEYLPTPFPPATHYAALDDVDAVPCLNDAGREAYRKFLHTDPKWRVFIIAPSGFAGYFNGGFDPLGRGLKACETRTRNCRVYAADDYVTWSRPTPAPAPTHFAAIDDAAAVPFVNEAGHQGYQKYLTLGKPKAFVIAPDGAWSLSALGDDPLAAALDNCRKKHTDCRLYAVDNDIVWPEGNGRR